MGSLHHCRRTLIKKHPTRHAAALCLSLCALTALHAQTLSQADYKAGKTHISETYKTDKAACQTHTGYARNVCIQEAKAKEKVARAELEYKHTGKASDRNRLDEVKAETDYAVAKEKCGNLASHARKACVEEAKAAEHKALTEARTPR